MLLFQLQLRAWVAARGQRLGRFDPVDAEYRPVPAGEPAHTVLISNLANRVQPILRYDLGDSVVQQPGPCPCGNPLPAVRVQGRCAEVLTFRTDGDRVTIPPLAFSTLADRTPGLQMFQIVQTESTKLRVRLKVHGAHPDRVWESIKDDCGPAQGGASQRLSRLDLKGRNGIGS